MKAVNSQNSFGMLMPGRSFSSSNGYRFGFNGKEKDNEIKGDGNSLDFGARICDSRLGRWASLDPLQTKYPSQSPYDFVGNMPIVAVDPTGKEIYFVIQDSKKGSAALVKANMDKIASVLNATEMGHALLEKYANSNTKDVYICIGTPKNDKNAYGSTTQHSGSDETGNEKFGVAPVSSEGGVDLYNGSNSNFEGTQIFKAQNENHFVVINEKY